MKNNNLSSSDIKLFCVHWKLSTVNDHIMILKQNVDALRKYDILSEVLYAVNSLVLVFRI